MIDPLQNEPEKLTVPIRLAGEPMVYTYNVTSTEPPFEMVAYSDYLALQSKLEAAEAQVKRLKVVIDGSVETLSFCQCGSDCAQCKEAFELLSVNHSSSLDK